MDLIDDLMLPDQFDSLLSCNFEGNDWTMDVENELNSNSLIEDLVFGNSDGIVHKECHMLDDALTQDILFAFDKEEKGNFFCKFLNYLNKKTQYFFLSRNR